MAQDWGAETLRRPLKLSDDQTPVIEVIKHASKIYPEYQDIALLYATSPFMTGKILDDAYFQFVTQQDPLIRKRPLLSMNNWKDAGMFCFYDRDHIERKNFRFYDVPYAIDINTFEDWDECLKRAS